MTRLEVLCLLQFTEKRERGMSSVCSCVFLPDPCCQLLCFHTFEPIPWWCQIARHSHGFTFRRPWEGALTRGGFPGYNTAPSLGLIGGRWCLVRLRNMSALVLIHLHLDWGVACQQTPLKKTVDKDGVSWSRSERVTTKLYDTLDNKRK